VCVCVGTIYVLTGERKEKKVIYVYSEEMRTGNTTIIII